MPIGVVDPVEMRARVQRALEQYRPGGRVAELGRLEGGESSITFATTVSVPGSADERIVVKVAPPGVSPTRNRDVLRQARIIEALGQVSGVPVPTVLFRDEGAPPEVPPFFAMTFAEG